MVWILNVYLLIKLLSGLVETMQVATQSNKVSWTVVVAAGKEWAKRSFRCCE